MNTEILTVCKSFLLIFCLIFHNCPRNKNLSKNRVKLQLSKNILCDFLSSVYNVYLYFSNEDSLCFCFFFVSESVFFLLYLFFCSFSFNLCYHRYINELFFFVFFFSVYPLLFSLSMYVFTLFVFLHLIHSCWDFFHFKNKANDLNKCTEINETRKCECTETCLKNNIFYLS